ncbi:excinuclease ABC subunit UvrA [Corynebacterium sp. 153RC1]|uniref:excinuclease ABC subunit UvrA n=1 Tax=unclassified Corynebacterium TaxID=2624378 RepID=UPI00211C3F33|nr:excinuclease ABC subunit UvrA [Corynebacterium sp. 209RC1]MCQ9353888.1 excinuclease ABC subunit UvrA [Corynebacterium sp. 1222RC1]MCQ9356919.1 excinuclease ABC subunit UvrA [Corynebacterium sp. 122RC1]MCQ9359749.1 excinuclease ABC subunit UvrA [Corynebacterium sp. 142RC1]MCQ9361387.1 excinuclease ABC subunit UvrA [Corynebacterium sp. 153RC1]MCQ9362969.1 excinuclease ABC subunit UvrA [Corynebacterium sp. 732RC1]MCQ9366086.1 excinuclease ABC subunit UvrA [Corynebacterium sp. 70RC1]
MADRLIVRGAREHNLKGVDIDLPRDSLVVFTGLSGSGKSSLAFDTIFAEGQRRYVESLSAYARQFLGQMDKPDVDFIEGLSPAVSIDQKSTNRNPRSTVGTITEVYDYLRLLYARAGTAHCPECDAVISRQTPQQIVDQVLEMEEGLKFQVLAPVVRTRKGEFVDLFQDLAAQGFSRVRVDGEVYQLSSPPTLEKQIKHDIDVVVDRLQVKASQSQRLTDSVETALKLADGVVALEFVDLEGPERVRRFSEKMACPNGHPIGVDELEPRSFSFNSPYGACPVCDGLGTRLEVDVDLVIPDKDAPLIKAIQPWQVGAGEGYYNKLLTAFAAVLGVDPNTPFSELSKQQQKQVLHGSKDNVTVRYKNRFGRTRTYNSAFEGALPSLERRLENTDSEAQKDRLLEYMREVPCKACSGARLRPEILSVRLASENHGEKSIADLAALSVEGASEFLDDLKLGAREEMIAGAVLKEIQARLRFLLDVGLNYLSLSRAAGTLSGGEAQRIRLATQIGSGLAGVLYVLDEPSIGLHQRDNQRLIQTLERLRDIGNTLIVVEHDEDTIKAADWLVDIGPKAGEYGGEVVYQGAPEGIGSCEESITGAYLSGKRVLGVPEQRREVDPERMLKVVGAKENNLRGIDVELPLGVLTCVTGVSGSGKSTVVNQILAKTLANKLNRARQVPGRAVRVEGVEHLDKLVQVDQSPIGRTPRSNPATYTGVFDKVRTLFAETQEAKVRGYKPGRFSFNVKGGRCEACQGDGTLKIEMNFLPDVYVPCEVCHGQRYNRETLEVRYKGKNIAEVLDMPIAEAAEFFEPITSIHRYLNTLTEVGLGYVRLGQSATTLSGGEAQRVKLASELQKRSNGRTVYILDEPTTGLHFEDIRKLMLVIQSLVDKGNSVIVIEHNLDVIKAADWIVDMGPEGGAGGGIVVAQGTPEEVAQVAGSYTGQFLKPLLQV